MSRNSVKPYDERGHQPRDDRVVNELPKLLVTVVFTNSRSHIVIAMLLILIIHTNFHLHQGLTTMPSTPGPSYGCPVPVPSGNILPLALGIGLGVGIPLIIILVLFAACYTRRKNMQQVLPTVEKSEDTYSDPKGAEDALMKQFTKYDNDGDGSITRDEVLLMFEVNMKG